MTVDEIISDVDDHGFSHLASARKVAALNETLDDVAGLEPWPFLETSTALNFAGSSPTPSNAPSDLRAVTRMFVTSTGDKVRPYRLDTFLDNYAGLLSESGTAQFYYFEGSTLKVWPNPPSSTAHLTLKYLKVPADVVAAGAENTILLPPRYHRAVLVNGTVEKLHALDDDFEAAAYFERKLDRAISRMRNDLWQVQFDEPDFIHIADIDDLF